MSSQWIKNNFVDAAITPLSDKVVQLVTSLLAISTALLTAVGIGSGITIRLLRNSPPLVVLFVIGLLLAITLAALAKTRKVLLIAGALFMAALGGFTWLAGTVSRAAERPHLVATAETTASGMVKIAATVKADGLTTKELIYLLARGHSRVRIDPTTGAPLVPDENSQADASLPRLVVEEAAFGPNASGSIDATFTFEVSPALYQDVIVRASRNRGHVRAYPGSGNAYEPECIPQPNANGEASSDDEMNYSCVRLVLPFGATRPGIAASLGMPDDKGRRLLTTSVTAVGVPPSKMVVVLVRAGTTALMRHTLAPDLVGKVQASPTTSVDEDVTGICVVAALVDAGGGAASGDTAQQSYCDQSSELPLTVSVAHL